MAVWSSFAFKNIGKNTEIVKILFTSFKSKPSGKALTFVPIRSSHDRKIEIRSSTFEGFKFKDLCYFYLTIGAIPFLAIILYANIFIGPAKLALIPEGYEPKPWEYYQHPITRFFAKYITESNQEAYERSLHNIFIKNEVQMIRRLERKVKHLIRDRGDYQAWYFEKPEAKYIRGAYEKGKRHEQEAGRAGGWILE